MDNCLDESTRDYASHLMRGKARSFYLAALFLPERARRDVQIVYAFYRTVDDLVDEPDPDWSRDEIFAALQWWEDGLRRSDPRGNGLLEALLAVMKWYGIAPSYLTMVLDGARFDLTMSCIETRRELMEYSVLVAGSVGMVMSHILGARSEEALQAACDLGVAMQLTNILRDVGEDLERNRVYLPLADLHAAGCTPADLHAGSVSPALRAVMRDLVGEARLRYDTGIRGVRHLDPSARFAIYLAATLYSRILDKIERKNFDVLKERVYLGTLEKWMVALPVYMQHRQRSWRYT